MTRLLIYTAICIALTLWLFTCAARAETFTVYELTYNGSRISLEEDMNEAECFALMGEVMVDVDPKVAEGLWCEERQVERTTL